MVAPGLCPERRLSGTRRVPRGRRPPPSRASSLDPAGRSCFPGKVPHDETLASLVPRLVAAAYFEDAATAVLEALFTCAEAAVAASPFSMRARLLRGVVHLRPDGTYQRLFGIERATGARVEGVGYLTSGNVWTWIEEHRCSVSIDVSRASIQSWLPDGPVEAREAHQADGLPGDATRERMLGRDATHVHVVPLRAPGGSVDGMITLEASCKSAAGQAFVWGACHEESGDNRQRRRGLHRRARAPAPPGRAGARGRVPAGRRPVHGAPRRAAPRLRPAGRHHPHQRPHGRRQVPPRAVVPRALATRGPALRGARHPRRARGPADGRALRLEAGGVHGRRQGQPGRHLARREGDALPRRDRQALPQGAGGPPALHRGALVPDAGRRHVRGADRRRALPGRARTPTFAPPSARAASARTSTGASTCCPCACSRSPSASTSSPAGPSTC